MTPESDVPPYTLPAMPELPPYDVNVYAETTQFDDSAEEKLRPWEVSFVEAATVTVAAGKIGGITTPNGQQSYPRGANTSPFVHKYVKYEPTSPPEQHVVEAGDYVIARYTTQPDDRGEIEFTYDPILQLNGAGFPDGGITVEVTRDPTDYPVNEVILVLAEIYLDDGGNLAIDQVLDYNPIIEFGWLENPP